MREKIAEILCPKCMYGGRWKCGDGKTPETCPIIKAILALIASEQKPLVEALQKSLQLCEKVIELAEHGDYSNGNTDGVIDEGSVLALRHLTELKKEYAALKGEVQHD